MLCFLPDDESAAPALLHTWKEDVRGLLALPHGELVERLTRDASAARFIAQYVRHRAVDDVPPREAIALLDDDVLLLLWRVVCDGGAAADAERLCAMLYEHHILDVPHLYSMCSLWARGAESESSLTCAAVVRGLLRLEPRYLDDVDRSVVAAVEAFDEVAVAALDVAPRSRALDAAADDLAAAASALSALLSVAPPVLACHFLPPMSIHFVSSLRSAYETTLPALLRAATSAPAWYPEGGTLLFTSIVQQVPPSSEAHTSSFLPSLSSPPVRTMRRRSARYA